MKRRITIIDETWPLAEPFVISRGSRVETTVVTVTLQDGRQSGLGEGTPTPRYGESVASVLAQIEAARPALADGMTRRALQTALPPGAARNALDAALWDLEAKQSGEDVGALSGLGWPADITSAQTVSIGTATGMGQAAAKLSQHPVIKIKLDPSNVLERVRAVRDNAPQATLLVDANESWSMELLAHSAPALRDLGVVMIEQPLPAGNDAALSGYSSPLPLYADESCHTRADLKHLAGKYQGINIKLDKTGGLTEAIALLKEAESLNFDIMVGCMLSTSLGIAPAMFVAQHASYVDLDAPALLAKDRPIPLPINDGHIPALPDALWGGATS